MRFPGFSDDWDKQTLGKIGKPYNGLSGKSGDDFGQGSPYITYKSIFDNSKVDISRVEYVTISENERIKSSQNTVEYGDIFFTTSSETPKEVGMTSVLLDDIEDCYLNSFCFGYRLLNKSKTLPTYFRFYLRSIAIRNKLSILAQGSTRFNISKSEVMRMVINLPDTSEQEKIATLLNAIDERIATQNKIIDNLQSLIKGLNDKFHDEVQGEFVSFSEIGTAYSGLSGKSGDDFGQGSPFITYLNVYQNNVINEDDFGLVTIAANESQHTISYGDVLFTLSSETPDEVGIGSVYLGESEKFYLNSFCFGVSIPNKDRIYPPYLAYLVSSTKFRKFVYPLAQGSTRFNLQKNDFMKKKFILPIIEEQHKIANTLDVLRQILATERHLNELYTIQKEHLLRNLFI